MWRSPSANQSCTPKLHRVLGQLNKTQNLIPQKWPTYITILLINPTKISGSLYSMNICLITKHPNIIKMLFRLSSIWLLEFILVRIQCRGKWIYSHHIFYIPWFFRGTWKKNIHTKIWIPPITYCYIFVYLTNNRCTDLYIE